MKLSFTFSKSLLAFFIITGLISSNHMATAQENTTEVFVKIEVDGLSCPFCAYGLEKNLKKIKGVKDVFISVKNAYTTFHLPRESQPTEEELKKVVDDAGFTARKVLFSDKPFERDEDRD